MNAFILITAVIVFFTFIISINVLMVRLTINKALRKFIIPKLQSQGLTYIDYKWVGLFDSGDFKDDNVFTVKPVSGYGNTAISIYVYIDYINSDKKKRITARIDTFTFFIKTVTYSREF